MSGDSGITSQSSGSGADNGPGGDSDANKGLVDDDGHEEDGSLLNSSFARMPVIPDDSTGLVPLVRDFVQRSLLLLTIWAVGALGLSFAWILLAFVLHVLRTHVHRKKAIKLQFKRDIALDERNVISSAIEYLPSWVHFPDRERAEWINMILKQLWPFIDELAKKTIRESVEPSVISCLPSYLKSFRFERVDLGSIPFRIASVKCYHKNTSREEIILDMDFNYAGNCDIQVRLKGLKAGIRDLHINGTLRVELRPLLKEQPIVGGVSMYFLQEPTIEFNLTNIADVLDMPGVSDILRKALSDQLTKLCVLPNKMVFPMASGVCTRELKCRPPAGAVRIELFEGKNLKRADVGMLGMGKSDPYALVAVGDAHFKTLTIKNTVNPKWNFACEAIVQFVHGQNIAFEVMDEDQGSKDDFLGRASVQLDTVLRQGSVEGWIKLEETTTGLLRYKVTWMQLEPSLEQLECQRHNSEKVRRRYPRHFVDQKDHRACLGSVAVICVYLDSAEGLPVLRGQEPSCYASLSIGNKSESSKVKFDNSCPVWEEVFHFLVGDPEAENDLRIELRDDHRDGREVGHVTYDLKSLIDAKDHEIVVPRPLRGKATGGTLYAHVQLRALRDCFFDGLVRQESTIDEEDSGQQSADSIVNSVSPPVPANLLPAKSATVPIPSLEDMIFSTVKPIIQVTGDDSAIVDRSQETRTMSAGDRDYSTSPEPDDCSNIGTFPKVRITLVKEERLVTLVIHRAINLNSVEGPHGELRSPDPYVKIICVPQKSREFERKSIVHRNTCDPVFEETFEFALDVFKGELTGFEIELRTKMTGSSFSSVFGCKKRLLGLAIVELNDLGSDKKVTQWYDLERGEDLKLLGRALSVLPLRRSKSRSKSRTRGSTRSTPEKSSID